MLDSRRINYILRLCLPKLVLVVIFLFFVLFIPVLILISSGFDPVAVLQDILRGTVGSTRALAYSLDRSTPIIFAALGAMIAFKSRVWNIGIQGQLLMGCLGASLVGLFFPLPRFLHLLFMGIAAFGFGSGWAVLAGYLKVKFKVNELVCTLLMNYIAYYIIVYLVRFPLKGPEAFGPTSDYLPQSARLPSLTATGAFSALSAGFFLTVVAAFVLWYLFENTVLGYRIKATGFNPNAAYLGGISTDKIVLVVMLLSGGVAGLAGFNEVSAEYGYLADRFATNFGFYGIAAALMGNLKPRSVFLSALLISFLLSGGRAAEASLGVPNIFMLVLISMMLISVLLTRYLESRISGYIGRVMMEK